MQNNWQPKKTKFKRLHKGRLKLHTFKKSKTKLNFGVWGLQLLKATKLTGKQIEAARRMMSRSLKKKHENFELSDKQTFLLVKNHKKCEWVKEKDLLNIE